MKGELVECLEDLLKLDDILACLISSEQTGVLTPKKGVKLRDIGMWKLISDTTDKFFNIAKLFYKYGLDRVTYELGKYEVIAVFINQVTILLVVIPFLANKGLIEVEIENTRRSIESILKKI